MPTQHTTPPPTTPTDTVALQGGPFAIVPAWVATHPDLKGSPLVVYCVLALHANQFRACWPGKARIGEVAHLSSNTVDEAIRALVAAGAISVSQRYDSDNRQTSNRYVLMHTPPQVVDHPPKSWEGGPPQELGGELDPEGTRSTMPTALSTVVAKPHPIKEILARYDRLFTERYGDRPDIGGKEVAIIDRLFKRYGQETVERRLEQFFTESDQFYKDAGHTLGAFSACWTKLVAQSAKQPNLISEVSQDNIRNAEAALKLLDEKTKLRRVR